MSQHGRNFNEYDYDAPHQANNTKFYSKMGKINRSQTQNKECEKEKHHCPTDKPIPQDTIETLQADFVVIGTGAAGSCLGYVLSSDPRYSVICLEAGPNVNNDPTFIAPVPGFDVSVFPGYYWPGLTLPDPNANNRTFNWTNGRLLGGGTSIYGMITTRGSYQRFDEWTPLVGPNWSGAKVYQAYKEMEKFFGPVPDPSVHGYNGPRNVRLGISDSTSTPQYQDAILATGAPGTHLIEDYNSPQTPIGVFRNTQYFQFPDQTRASSSRTFLGPNVMDAEGNGVNGRKLKLITQATATHLIWSKKNPTQVKGVYAVVNGKPIKIKARQRVILSAGLKSSAFLQVNGIGPVDVLQAAGVPVRVPLDGVGKNLKNGPYIATILFPPPGTQPNSQPGSFNEIGAFLPDPRPGEPLNLRNVQLSSSLRNYPQLGGFISIFIVETPLRPKSSGYIRINGNDPLRMENVDIGFLNDPDDLEEAAAVFTTIVRPVYQYLQDNFGYIPILPDIATIDDPEALRNFIRNNVGNGHHYQCFNKMGPVSNGGVVDDWGHVHGVQGLSVVDDSIAPINTDGNTGYTAEMIAWRIGRHYLEELGVNLNTLIN